MENKRTSCNWLKNYRIYAEELTDAPADYHHFISLSVLATAIGNRACFQFGDLTIYPNLWMVILAPSSLYRKSTAISIGKNILTLHYANNIYPSEFSHEKILETITEQPYGTFVFFEFLTFIQMLSRDYMSGAKSMMTELFDAPDSYIRKTLKNAYTIRKPVISILSASTVQWFLEQVKEQDIEGGFLPRFLFVPSITKLKSLALPPEVDKSLKYALGDDLKALVESIKPNSGQEHYFSIEGKAKELYENWYRDYEKLMLNDPQRYKSFMVRYNVYLLKFALVYQCALDNKSNMISEEAVSLAIADIQFLTGKIETLCSEELAFTKDEKIKLKVKKIIFSRPEGISQTEILRKSGLLAFQLNRVLDTLKQEQYIIDKFIETGGDKPTKVWASF